MVYRKVISIIWLLIMSITHAHTWRRVEVRDSTKFSPDCDWKFKRWLLANIKSLIDRHLSYYWTNKFPFPHFSRFEKWATERESWRKRETEKKTFFTTWTRINSAALSNASFFFVVVHKIWIQNTMATTIWNDTCLSRIIKQHPTSWKVVVIIEIFTLYQNKHDTVKVIVV